MGVGVEDVGNLVRLGDLPDEDGGNDEVDLEELEASFVLL